MSKQKHHGFASIPLLVFMLVVVTVVITQAHYTSSARFGDDIAQTDSVAAFFLAESGIESGAALLATAADQVEFDAACDRLKTWQAQGPTALGRGTLSYTWQAATSDTVAEISSCTYRSTGQVNQAKRTLEKLVEFTVQKGVAGFSQQESPGSSITVTPVLRVKSSKASVAVLTSAYRINGSEGYDAVLTDGLNASADLVCPSGANCPLMWDLTSSGGGAPSVGSIAVASPMSAGATVEISQKIFPKGGSTVQTPRNYVQVGVLVQGNSASGTPPNIEGAYGDAGTTNSSASAVSTGYFLNLSTNKNNNACNDSRQKCICYKSDLLLFAVAGRSNAVDLGNKYSASFDNVIFDSGASGYNVPLIPLQHYPPTFEAASGAQGDLFAEMWFGFNNKVFATIATTNNSDYKDLAPVCVVGASPCQVSQIELKVTISDGSFRPPFNVEIKNELDQKILYPIRNYLRLIDDCSTGTGSNRKSCNLPAGTFVHAVSGDRVTLRWPGSPGTLTRASWASKALCGGICAFQRIPSLVGGRTDFEVQSLTTKSADKWAGGLICLTEIGEPPLSSLSRQQVAGRRWREISSEDQ